MLGLELLELLELLDPDPDLGIVQDVVLTSRTRLGVRRFVVQLKRCRTVEGGSL